MEDEVGAEQWVFTEETLLRARESARNQASNVLRSATAAGLVVAGSPGSGGELSRSTAREPPRPLSLDESSRLVLFHARKVPELCGRCGAPSEVCWTALVFYRRFFAVRSPMEFGPLPMMFACVHVACKIEEVHEITLDKLLEAADVGIDATLRDKVASLELPLLEGIEFVLLVEPKPDAALRMLSDELRNLFSQGLARDCAAENAVNSPPARGGGGLTEVGWTEVMRQAEELVLDLAVRTDAILLWPTSTIISAALCVALDTYANEPSVEGHCGSSHALSEMLCSLLDANLESERQRASIRAMVQEVRRIIEAMISNKCEMSESGINETAKHARRCLRSFERLRSDATERHEAHRKERKRRWCEMKGLNRRAVPTPILHDFSELTRRAAALRETAAFHEDTGDFVLHRLRSEEMGDMEDS